MAKPHKRKLAYVARRGKANDGEPLVWEEGEALVGAGHPGHNGAAVAVALDAVLLFHLVLVLVHLVVRLVSRDSARGRVGGRLGVEGKEVKAAE